jgi:hypothetical protein
LGGQELPEFTRLATKDLVLGYQRKKRLTRCQLSRRWRLASLDAGPDLSQRFKPFLFYKVEFLEPELLVKCGRSVAGTTPESSLTYLSLPFRPFSIS